MGSDPSDGGLIGTGGGSAAPVWTCPMPKRLQVRAGAKQRDLREPALLDLSRRNLQQGCVVGHLPEKGITGDLLQL
jgi:hypothetical protein